jgi:PKHD-type hydroxylase
MPQVNRYDVILNQHTIWNNAFTPDEVDQIISLESLQKFERGRVGLDGNVDEKARISDISWLFEDDNSRWIFERFSWILPKVNYQHFMYDISHYDSFQYTIYGEEGHHYGWHQDTHIEYLTFERKISATIMLSDPNDYLGGELEIIQDGSPDRSLKLKPEKGDIVFFASWMPHRVLPIVSGVRKSLVCWVQGKRSW